MHKSTLRTGYNPNRSRTGTRPRTARRPPSRSRTFVEIKYRPPTTLKEQVEQRKATGLLKIITDHEALLTDLLKQKNEHIAKVLYHNEQSKYHLDKKKLVQAEYDRIFRKYKDNSTEYSNLTKIPIGSL